MPAPSSVFEAEENEDGKDTHQEDEDREDEDIDDGGWDDLHIEDEDKEHVQNLQMDIDSD
jgi:hypothetical protein